METRLSLAPGQNGTKKLLATYGERLLRVRYRYDAARGVRHKTVELIVETTPWNPRRERAPGAGRHGCDKDSLLRNRLREKSRLRAQSGAQGTGCGRLTGRPCGNSDCRTA